MDIGLERAGFQHVFFAEVDEWRRGILAHHWPSVPIYHDVRDVARTDVGEGEEGHVTGGSRTLGGVRSGTDVQQDDARLDARLLSRASELDEQIREGSEHHDGRWGIDLLCGGPPCQDVSVAGKRAGLAGARSGLFFEFARIAGVIRPKWLLIENVPGLLTSHSGRDFGVVAETLAELGYGVAWRVLDSRYFGVPQRRRRVFIVGTIADGDPRAAAERAGQVLAIGASCQRHPAKSAKARTKPAPPPGGGSGEDHYYVEDHEDGTLRANGNGGPPRSDKQPLHAAGGSVRRLTPVECERLQGWPDGWTNPTGLEKDTRRYAAIGDGVTAPVAEWIGRKIMAAEGR
jgi:DNA (cytosine-5)-methyltransferase 1